ncbi:MAG: hypothetical protein KJ065_15345 [Anaerolineae bacterium]|nr:hypothetical protein [Anaerolineae bacterium]
MLSNSNSKNLILALSCAALLSFLGRTFLDYGYVFPEFGVTITALLAVTLGVLAFYGVWLWSLLAVARGSRKGLVALLIFDLLLVVFGVSTFTTSCPSPCPTAWPLGEILLWSNVVIGTAACLTALRQLVRRGSDSCAVFA